MKRLLLLPLLALALGACTSDPAPTTDDAADAAGPLVVYTGRSEALVGPLVERFRAATGLEVEVRYGKDAELLAALQEEGGASPADVFWANTAGALGAATEAGLFVALPDSLTARPAAFVPSSGLWVPVTTRFRVLAYSPARVDSAALPASVLELPRQAALRGRIGWTPTYSSFQDFVTALRLTQGEAPTRMWLSEMKGAEPKAYPSNGPMLEALAAGEIDVALTNHYYVARRIAADTARAAGTPPAVAVHHFAEGDPGNLALVTGAGVLATSARRAAARRFLAFLLSDAAQSEAAATVQEYPVVRGATLPPTLLPLDRAVSLSPTLDFERLRDLDATLQLLRAEELL